MSGFSYEHFSVDFSMRTKSNLELIEHISDIRKRKNDNNHSIPITKESIFNDITGPCYKSYEVTQLILSMYGMLLVPFEKYKNDPTTEKKATIKALSMDPNYRHLERIIATLKRQNRLKSTYNDRYDGPVYSFIHHLRNSISHEGIHFYPISAYASGPISEIIFYDFDYSRESPAFETATTKFCTKVTVSELREIIGYIMTKQSKMQTA